MPPSISWIGYMGLTEVSCAVTSGATSSVHVVARFDLGQLFSQLHDAPSCIFA